MQLRTRIARATAAGALVLTTPLLSACGMSFATDAVYTPAPGANDRDGRVDVLNALIVATENGSGTFVATLVNNEVSALEGGRLSDVTDRLTSLRGAGESTLTAQLEPVEIPGGGMARLADGSGIPVEGSDIQLGHFVEVELTFANAEPVRIEVPVVPNNGVFAGQDGEELTPTTVEEIDAESHDTGSDH